MHQTGVEGMEGYAAAVSLLPQPLNTALMRVSPDIAKTVQEIRLHVGRAVMLGMRGTVWYLQSDGSLATVDTNGVCCTDIMLQSAVQRLSQYSLYAHTEELRRGFITANGCRVGIAGTAITEHGTVVGYRSIDALCLRVARIHRGCAEQLAERLCEDGAVHSALLCGEPSSGKTSLLRDLALQFSKRRLSVSVIDERGEIGGVQPLHGCDVLRYTPKPTGIEQAVRCLAPQVILVDELGDEAEIRAVCDGMLRGVPTIATVHGKSLRELYRRTALGHALRDGVFDCFVRMQGRVAPGSIAEIIRVEDG